MAADFVVQTQQRADAYWFLASLFGNSIDVETLERFADVAVTVDETGLAGEIHAVFAGEKNVEALSQRLAIEHTRLFLGLRKGYGMPPPYESLWREKRIMGDTTLAVAEAYSKAGFDDKGPWGPCDHIAYELRFMASLCQAEVDANQPEEADWARKTQKNFLRKHLLVWIPSYCQELSLQAKEPLYKALARVTGNMLAEDDKAVSSNIEGLIGERRPLTENDLARGE